MKKRSFPHGTEHWKRALPEQRLTGTANSSWPGMRFITPVPNKRQVSWLADHHKKPPSQHMPVTFSGFSFPAYSDEIAQALHLFPFYPPACAVRTEAPLFY